MTFVPYVKFCAICDRQIPGDSKHILCEYCRVQHGGYKK